MQDTENDIIHHLPYNFNQYMREVVEKARNNPLLSDREVFFKRDPLKTYS